MPKVKKYTFQKQGLEFSIQINVNSKGLFYTDRKHFPQTLLPVIEAKFNTQQAFEKLEEVESHINAAVEYGLKHNITKEGVIRVELGFRDKTYAGLNREGVDVGRYRSGFSEKGSGFTFIWTPLIKVLVGEEVKEYRRARISSKSHRYIDSVKIADGLYLQEEGDFRQNRSLGYIEIEFTRENMEFLKGIDSATVLLANRMVDFFGSDPALLQEKINNGIKLIE